MISLYNGILLSIQKKILLAATRWMNLEDTLQNEISLAQKEKY